MSETSQAYEGYEFEATVNLENYYRWITKKFAPYLSGAGAEIGAGQGIYAPYIRPYLSSLDLVEPSPVQTDALISSFKDDPCVRVFPQSIDDYHAEIGDDARESICLVNVLEHIDDDRAALRSFYDILKRGGHVCIFVPAMPILYSKLDALFGHHRRYRRDDLNEKLISAGFRLVDSRYMDLLGVAAWGLINRLLGSTSLDPRMARLYDRICVPITQSFESIVKIPIGKSLLVVGRKDC